MLLQNNFILSIQSFLYGRDEKFEAETILSEASKVFFWLEFLTIVEFFLQEGGKMKKEKRIAVEKDEINLLF